MKQEEREPNVMFISQHVLKQKQHSVFMLSKAQAQQRDTKSEWVKERARERKLDVMLIYLVTMVGGKA